MIEAVELRGKHLVLAHTGANDSLLLTELVVELLNNRLRRNLVLPLLVGERV